MGKMRKPIVLSDGKEAAIICPTVEQSDLDLNGEVWTEKTNEYEKVLFDYFFLTEGVWEELIGIDHVYPEEFEDIEKASDHIPIVLDLGHE